MEKRRRRAAAVLAFDGKRAIRGGVPVIFPQFAERGTGMRHGFARVSNWRLADSGAGFAVFTLTQADLAPAIAQAWPHGFELQLRAAVQGQSLTLALEVRNTGSDPFAFSSALHTYYLVDAVGEVVIGGVQDEPLRIADKIDQIYPGIKGSVSLAQPGGTLTMTQSGFRDAVVWNPGAADAKALADLGDDEYLHFVCVEPALIEPMSMEPGAAWRGELQVSAAP
jgi:glucose-6-phosphate 1-epimerase